MKRRTQRIAPALARVAASIVSSSGAGIVFLSVATAMVVVAPPLHAQDQKPMSDYDKRLDFLNNRLIPIVPQDFNKGMANFREFVQANPNLNRWERVQVFANSGTYLYFQTPEEKRAAILDQAVGVLNEGLQYVKDNPNPNPKDQSRDMVELSHNKIMVLLAAKKYHEAATVLDYVWPMALEWGGNIDNWCRYWRAVRTQEGKPQLAVDGLVKAYEQRMAWRGEPNTDISLSICDELVSQGKDEEALSWAKQSFMMCNFDENSIKEATKAITKILATRDLSVAKANVFATAQTNPSAFNPLDAVKLPQYDTAPIRARLADTGLDSRVRFTCLLAVGDYRNAMLEARSRLVADVGNEDNARQVARVFKAKDADIARANQFLAYYQAGEGENPIPAFLKETEATK